MTRFEPPPGRPLMPGEPVPDDVYRLTKTTGGIQWEIGCDKCRCTMWQKRGDRYVCWSCGETTLRSDSAGGWQEVAQ